MTRETRPRMYPAPEFPPRKTPLFSRTPPAIFPVLLGLIGLGLALRRGFDELGLPGDVAELGLGAVGALWAFAIVAYGIKLARRPGVLVEEFAVLPSRAGVAAASIGGMALASALVPYAPGSAMALLLCALGLHAAQAVVWVLALRQLSGPARRINPTVHLTWVGFIVGGLAAAELGMDVLVAGLFWSVLPVAVLIWGISAWQLFREVPPAPLRPLLAVHLAPASLLCSVAALIGQPELAVAFAVLGGLILVGLLISSRWIVAAGFSPMWGAFTFPLAAYAGALFAVGWEWPGVIVLIAAVGLVPAVAWRVLKMWPGGNLAARTNAALA